MRSALHSFHAQSSSTGAIFICGRLLILFSSFLVSRTAARISDACQQEVDLILNSTELAALVPSLQCTYVLHKIRPNFCSNDLQYRDQDLSYQNYCENTLGMKFYFVDTWRMCGGVDYYTLNDAYCIGKSCTNETEIQEVLSELYFPLWEQSAPAKYNLTCNTTFGQEGSREKCDAQTEVMQNTQELDDLFSKIHYVSSALSLCGPAFEEDCLIDLSIWFRPSRVEPECLMTGENVYQKLDHRWDCVDLGTGATFQYTILNDTYCDGTSCSRSVPDYSDAFASSGCACNLTEVAEKLSSDSGAFTTTSGHWFVVLLLAMVSFL